MFAQRVKPSIVRLLGAGLKCSQQLSRGLNLDETCAVTVESIGTTNHQFPSRRLKIGAWAGPASSTGSTLECTVASRDVA